MVCLAAFLAAWVGSASAAPSSLPRLLTQDAERPFQIFPNLVSFTGDGTGYVAGRISSPRHRDRGAIRWLRWSPRFALGRGWVWANDCIPYCATGDFTRHRGTIKARRVRRNRYTRLIVRYHYKGRLVIDRRSLGGGGRYPHWG